MKALTVVRQEDHFGCAVACVATVLGHTYQAVREAFGEVGRGFTKDVWSEFLARRGYAVQHLYRIDQLTNRPRPQWPLPAWAPVHLCSVDAGGPGAHLVVMLADGTVLDPATGSDRRLSDYSTVYSMTGLYLVDPPPPWLAQGEAWLRQHADMCRNPSRYMA